MYAEGFKAACVFEHPRVGPGMFGGENENPTPRKLTRKIVGVRIAAEACVVHEHRLMLKSGAHDEETLDRVNACLTRSYSRLPDARESFRHPLLILELKETNPGSFAYSV